ncbi:60S ribosomal protein L9B [Polyrhizophydium stewartii]|uniref:60S ribosomal protein L9B n=1 Tax=Polyrhizophydium stewartii TaxID=2732419 RepID=A0ABR4N276_9FUNG|nr:60S ribosomal protein L9 [Polyrhizophydium stewartii]
MKSISQERDITIPDEVTLTANARVVNVKGPRGELTKSFKHIQLDITRPKKDTLRVKVWHGGRKHVACIRTVCSHIENMIKGVTKGFEYKMRFVYAHFPINANITDDKKTIEVRNFLGDKNTRRVKMLPGVTVDVTSTKDEIVLVGNDIQNVSQSAATIQQSVLVKNKDIRKFLDGIYVSEKGLLVKD